MTISELRVLLEQIQNRLGDLKVKICSDDCVEVAITDIEENEKHITLT